MLKAVRCRVLGDTERSGRDVGVVVGDMWLPWVEPVTMDVLLVFRGVGPVSMVVLSEAVEAGDVCVSETIESVSLDNFSWVVLAPFSPLFPSLSPSSPITPLGFSSFSPGGLGEEGEELETEAKEELECGRLEVE